MARIILIEGFPGSGKSTTAQFLARLLARRGGRARWIYEGEVPNPLVPTAPASGYESWEQFVDVRVERWRAFAAAAGDHDVTIIPESALLQLPVFTMLRRNAEASIIARLVDRLVEAVAPLRPRLVYLARRDPEAAFRAIGERRGLSWLLHHAGSSEGYTFTQARGLSGFDGLLAYWRAHAELCDALVEAIDVPKLVLDVGPDGWAERRRRICDFADVPFEDEPAPGAAELERIAGRYGDGRREVTVEMVDGRLVARWTLWLTNALLPVRRNVFDLESSPVRVSFETDAAGHVHAFHCSGPRLAWDAPPGVFKRIATSSP
jgi:hypothetical protein